MFAATRRPRIHRLTTIYLTAVAFGCTLLIASLVLGGKDAHGIDHTPDVELAWAPVMSLRFWVFFLAFGGGAGYALTRMGTGEIGSALGAAGTGWATGTLAVLLIRQVTRNSVSSQVDAKELIGSTGTLLLPAGPGRPGKVRLDIKGHSEDFVATLVDDGLELATGAQVLVVAEGEQGTLLVAKAEM